MKPAIYLDSGPVGLLVHEKPIPVVRDCRSWLDELLKASYRVVLPEIVDYEIRQELNRLDKDDSIVLLDDLKEKVDFLSLNSPAILLAAQMWGGIRKIGRPTASPDDLDIDVILAAQAATEEQGDFIVATTNPTHLSLLVPSKFWYEIEP